MAENIVLPKQVEDLTGRKFGRLTARRYAGGFSDGYKTTTWECLCDCGNTREVRANSLKSGHTQSCGCLKPEVAKATMLKHGFAETSLYKAWVQMKARCLNPSSRKWDGYGGRGIQICDRWANSFEAFLTDMGMPPTPRHSIDRIDVNGNYEPGNCRWATPVEQARNRRNNRMLTLGVKTQCIAQWSEELKIPKHTIRDRVGRQGWSDEKALTTPTRKKRA